MSRKWYVIVYKNDKYKGFDEGSELIFKIADGLGIECGFIPHQDMRDIYVYCKSEELTKLLDFLGQNYSHGEVDNAKFKELKKSFVKHYPDNDKKKNDKLDEKLVLAINDYNLIYTNMNDAGLRLFNYRVRSIDLLDIVENLINSIANHPKDFDSDISEIRVHKEDFKEVCYFAKKELEAAQKSAIGGGSGVAGGMAVASLAPSAAMWVASTFGTASTGTAISSLSGAAASKAALAWIGGGAISAGGGGIAGGEAILALAGPIGWGIAGAMILTSIVIFANKKLKLDKEKKEEIESVLKNVEIVKEINSKIEALVDKTDKIREGLNGQYLAGLKYYGKDFMELSEDEQTELAAIVNNAKSLSVLLGEGV